jgi:CMP-N-acetylneuraminic acid synthetase
VSVTEVPHQFSPVSVMTLDEGGRLRSYLPGATVTRRQEKPQLFARNGPAVLAVRTVVLEAGTLYGDDSRAMVMARRESLDIDDAWDLEIAELLLSGSPEPGTRR